MEENNNLNESNNEIKKDLNSKAVNESLEFKPISNESAANMVAMNSNSGSNNQKKKKSKDEGPGFVRTVLLPFTCGILGAGIVVGTCFGIPSVRNNLFTSFTSSEEANLLS